MIAMHKKLPPYEGEAAAVSADGVVLIRTCGVKTPSDHGKFPVKKRKMLLSLFRIIVGGIPVF
jgi:hypothetical protein